MICSVYSNESRTTTTTSRNINFIPLNDDQPVVVVATSTTTSTTTTVVEHNFTHHTSQQLPQLSGCNFFPNETTSSNQQMNSSSRNKNAKQLQKRNLFLEEPSKSVRRKRIGDSKWHNYAEANRNLVLNEKCFYLEPITRKWMHELIRKGQTIVASALRSFGVRSLKWSHCQLDPSKPFYTSTRHRRRHESLRIWI